LELFFDAIAASCSGGAAGTRFPTAEKRDTKRAVTFGRQRPPSDVAAMVLLLTGFSALAVALWSLRGTWIGVVLPLAFVVGAIAGLRTEVREVEVRDEALIVKTFLRAYALPREHIVRVVRSEGGVAVDVVNGARYDIAPPDVDGDAMFAALRAWLG
jgi:hypothetical protein